MQDVFRLKEGLIFYSGGTFFISFRGGLATQLEEASMKKLITSIREAQDKFVHKDTDIQWQMLAHTTLATFQSLEIVFYSHCIFNALLMQIRCKSIGSLYYCADPLILMQFAPDEDAVGLETFVNQCLVSQQLDDSLSYFVLKKVTFDVISISAHLQF